MENIGLIIIGLVIIYQAIKLFKDQRELKKELKRMEDDWDKNIEFEGYVGSGISQKKKNYPTLNDDHIHGARIEPTKDKDHIA